MILIVQQSAFRPHNYAIIIGANAIAMAYRGGGGVRSVESRCGGRWEISGRSCVGSGDGVLGEF